MNSVLIVRACAIGDFILNIPVLRAMYLADPNISFTLVGYSPTLQLARDFVPVDAIHSIEGEPWSRLFYEPIPALSFDSAVVWMKDRTVADNLRASGVPGVIRGDSFPEYGHAAAHLLRTLGLPEPPLPDLWEQENEDIIVHASSGSPSKNWPYFDELISQVGDSCLSLWERPEREARRVRVDVATNPSALTRPSGGLSQRERQLGNLSLPEVSQYLRRCRAYIGNDSGITHLAAYLGVPTIALFGPTNPRIWGPIGRRTRIIWKTKLEDISVDEVLQTLQWLT